MGGEISYDYADETAIITGSTRGIGKGIASGLAGADANVIINSPNEDEVSEVANKLDQKGSGTVVGVAADMQYPPDIDMLIQASIEHFGQIDLLVNNAAIWPREDRLVTADIDDWNRTMKVNVRAQFCAAQRVARHMIEADVEGSIINHTSQAGDRRTDAFGLYGISKTAIRGLTWRMAQELAENNIRMNAISTDVTETHQTRKEARMQAETEDRTPEEILQDRGKKRPLGRVGQPVDLAHAVMFLASEKADYIVGDTLRVSGGGNLM